MRIARCSDDSAAAAAARSLSSARYQNLCCCFGLCPCLRLRSRAPLAHPRPLLGVGSRGQFWRIQCSFGRLWLGCPSAQFSFSSPSRQALPVVSFGERISHVFVYFYCSISTRSSVLLLCSDVPIVIYCDAFSALGSILFGLTHKCIQLVQHFDI